MVGDATESALSPSMVDGPWLAYEHSPCATLLLRRIHTGWVVVGANRAAEALVAEPSPGRKLSEVFAASAALVRGMEDGLRRQAATLGEMTLQGASSARTLHVTTRRWSHDHAVLFLEDRTDVVERTHRLEREVHTGRQQARLQALGTLAGGIAHEFNNVLLGLTGFAELALERTRRGQSNAEEVREVLDAAGRAKRLVQRILLFSRRSEEGARVRIDLNEVLVGMKAFLRQTLPPNVKVQWYLSAGPLWIEADPDQIEHCLLNLATNGRDAMPTGGVLHVQTQKDGDDVVWVVRDEGTGMDRETLSRATEPFFTRKPPGAGTGLGLSAVHGVVRGHRGRLELSSQVGKGTEVRIHLPLAPAPVEPSSDPSQDLMPTRGLDILLVDDEPTILRSSKRILELDAHRVCPVSRAEEAWEALASRPFDLVILDLAMPGMGGAELLDRIVEAYPGQPIILSSGEHRSLETMRSRNASVRVLAKPYGRKELRREVRLALAPKDP